MEKLLLIAEKPSLMRELQSVYRNNKGKIPYDIDFIALAGHVCCYAKPDEYNIWNKKWIELNNDLPMFPETWKIDVMESKKELFKKTKDMITSKKYNGLICATDADREGNLIFHLLESKIKPKKKCYRLWVNDLTEKAILKAYLNMVDLHKDSFQKNLTFASVLRSRFDWLIGMNITVAATVRSGMIMKIGRVKTPTLKIVYDNSKAIDNFVPKTSYGLEVKYKEGFSGTLIIDEKEAFFNTPEEAEKYESSDIKAKVRSIEKKKVKTIAPALFKLSDLQVYANKHSGYTAEETLSIVQSLYEKKIVTYPRCDCRVVSSETAKDFRKLLSAITVFPELEKFVKSITNETVLKISKTKKYVDDNEVNKSSHTALIPTGEKADLSKLSEKEKDILMMIYKRFLSIFLPPIIEEKTVLIAENNKNLFKSTGKIICDKGFSSLFGTSLEENIIPKDITEGTVLKIDMFEVKKKTSTPPARLTEGELVKTMENISKYIGDKDLKVVMKEAKGIGTPSSRGSIISSLIKDGYIDVKKVKKSEYLYISDKGTKYIENIKDFDVIAPELTAEWETKLKKVEQGELNSKDFNDQMINFVKNTVDKISKTKMERLNPFTEKERAESLGKCPRCGKTVVEFPKSFSCIGFKDKPPCGFSIWKENKLLSTSGKKLTAAKIKKLLSKGFYEEKGLKSKAGKKYDAKITLEDTGKYINLKINF